MDYALVPESVRPQVESSNAKVLGALVLQLRSPLGVIPFLGAGISASLKYRQWGAFLSNVAANELRTADRATVDEALAKEDFLRAAGLLAHALGAEDFQRTIAEEFSDERLKGVDFTSGLYGYLPLITAGPAITTNFDRVIERVFEVAGHRFSDCVYGANPDQVVAAMQQNRPVLWKLHGDRNDRRTRVLSDDEYDRHYIELERLLLIALLNRPALFIGCSLDKDRTTDVLVSVRAEHPSSNHYAFLQIPETVDAFEDRRDRLRVMGVRPIWYPKGQHRLIEILLSDIVRASSSIRLPITAVPVSGTPSIDSDEAARRLESEISKIADKLLVDPEKPARHDTSIFEEFSGSRREVAPFELILDRMTRGRLAFFLGAGASLGKLPLGKHFYSDLIERFGADDTGSSPVERFGAMPAPRITQHFADTQGRDALDARVGRELVSKPPEPTAIHWFVTTLHHRLSAKGIATRPPWIFTTNCDDWTEHALRVQGTRFHLFTYRATDPHAGAFVYRSPSGAVDVIDRPAHFRRLGEDCTVVVKLHGGAHRDIALPLSYAFMQRDFVQLAGRIPGAVPRVLLDRIVEDSFVFLGSGLGDDSIESFVREAHAVTAKKRSWAVLSSPRPETEIYWRALGLDVIDTSLEYFIYELNRRVDELPR